MTDKVRLAVVTKAVSHSGDRLAKSVNLYVRCKGRKGTGNIKHVHQGGEVFIHWDRYMGIIDDTFRGQVRWDSEPAVDTRWDESTNNDSTFLSRGESDFVRKMYEHKNLRVRIWDFRGRSHDATFNVQGLKQHIEKHPQLCSGLRQ